MLSYTFKKAVRFLYCILMQPGGIAYVHSLQASYIDLSLMVIQSENVDMLTLSWVTSSSTSICLNKCVMNLNAPVQHMLACSYCNICPQETSNSIQHRKRFDTKSSLIKRDFAYVFV